MRRFPICTTVAATLVLSGSFVVAQTPLFPRNPARVGGVRAGEQFANAQQPGTPGGPMPMPQQVPSVVVPPVRSPMGTGPMIPAPQGGSTLMPAPREVVPGVPSATAPYSGMPGGYSMTGDVYPGNGYPMGEAYPGTVGGDFQGGANTCGGPFSYLNDAPPGSGMGSCAPGSDCGPFGRPGLARFVQPGKWYSSAEYLMWWTKSNRVPPLLTTSNAADNGFLGSPSTRILLGDQSIGDLRHSGGRFNLGYWLGCEQRWGFDGTFLFLGRNSSEFATASGGDPLLARPFLNGNTNQPFSQIIAFPGQSAGSFNANYETALWGFDANLRRYLWGNPCHRLDGLIGYKYLNLNEQLTLRETVTRSPNGFPGIAPNAVSAIVTDTFHTENRFHGGQLGLIGETRRGRWYLDSTLKVALGNMNQTARINGSQVVTNTNGTTSAFSGGLLALPGANIGTFTQNKFAVVPEATMNVGYHLTPHLRVFVGYNFLYASSVLRPSDQIDTTLDTTRIPNFATTATRLGEIRPSPTLKDSTFFAQGISFGLQFKW